MYIDSIEKLIEYVFVQKKILIFGAGEVAEIFFEWLEGIDYPINQIIIYKSNPEHKEFFHGLPIRPYTDLAGYDSENSVIIATHKKLHEEIILNLRHISNCRSVLFTEKLIEDIKYQTVKMNRNRNILSITYSDVPNVGDKLNKFLLKELYGVDTNLENIHYSEIIGIGSGLFRLFSDAEINNSAEYELYVWGTGFIADKSIESLNMVRENVVFECVRGEKTRKKLEKYLGTKMGCVMGDPGLLCRMLGYGNNTKKYKIGIIPHFREGASCMKGLGNEYSDAIFIDMKSDVDKVLRTISECECIITSSLHGAIIADSFGIPNMLVKISDIPYGDGFKYMDYYSIYGIEYLPYDLRIRNAPSIRTIKSEYAITENMVKKITLDINESFKRISSALSLEECKNGNLCI